MTTITIPKKITKGEELIIIPRRDYEQLFDLKEKIRKMKIIDGDLEKSLKELRRGKIFGPFKTVDSLIKSLDK